MPDLSSFHLDDPLQRLFHLRVPGSVIVALLRYWLPIVALMALIFGGSTDMLSSSRTSRFIGPILRWLVPGISSEAVATVQLTIRKTGHILEYALLAFLFWRAFRKPRRNDPRPWMFHHAIWAVAAAGAYAVTDEFHQLFVASRGASVLDVLLDTLGAALGVFAVWAWGRWRKRW
jgi:VanZ family protein